MGVLPQARLIEESKMAFICAWKYAYMLTGLLERMLRETFPHACRPAHMHACKCSCQKMFMHVNIYACKYSCLQMFMHTKVHASQNTYMLTSKTLKKWQYSESNMYYRWIRSHTWKGFRIFTGRFIGVHLLKTCIEKSREIARFTGLHKFCIRKFIDYYFHIISLYIANLNL
jgi:hypothetical protein